MWCGEWQYSAHAWHLSLCRQQQHAASRRRFLELQLHAHERLAQQLHVENDEDVPAALAARRIAIEETNTAFSRLIGTGAEMPKCEEASLAAGYARVLELKAQQADPDLLSFSKVLSGRGADVGRALFVKLMRQVGPYICGMASCDMACWGWTLAGLEETATKIVAYRSGNHCKVQGRSKLVMSFQGPILVGCRLGLSVA